MTEPKLGLRANWGQFSLLVLVNAFVGGMVGLERTILPAIAQEEFHLAAKSAILSFIVVFGLSKALTNYLAGRYADRFGRKPILVAGWLVALPVPFLLMWAPTWTWITVANLLLGISQGLTWSTTVIMKIDLVGPRRRGLAMGLNEFAGYFAVALAAWATGYIAARVGLRPQPFYLGIAFAGAGLFLSAWVVRETHAHAKHEATNHATVAEVFTPREVFLRTSFRDRELSSVSQAGLVNNLNDGMAWGLLPLVFSAAQIAMDEMAWLTALYPATWGLLQLFTGALSDRLGRKWLIAAGMWVQALGIALMALGSAVLHFATGSLLLGVGTAMVYPTLLAAIGDVAHPSWRASAVGVYRLWRDSGYAVGAMVAGITADLLGLNAAVWLVAAITFVSGLVVAARMRETLHTGTEAKQSNSCMQPTELAKLLATAPSQVTIVDVRSPEEYAAGHIEGAINIPLDRLPDLAATLSKHATLVTVCGKGGGRSERAAELLRQRGFARAVSLCGGTFGWISIHGGVTHEKPLHLE